MSYCVPRTRHDYHFDWCIKILLHSILRTIGSITQFRVIDIPSAHTRTRTIHCNSQLSIHSFRLSINMIQPLHLRIPWHAYIRSIPIFNCSLNLQILSHHSENSKNTLRTQTLTHQQSSWSWTYFVSYYWIRSSIPLELKLELDWKTSCSKRENGGEREGVGIIYISNNATHWYNIYASASVQLKSQPTWDFEL